MFDLDSFYRACDEQDGAEIAELFSEPASPEMQRIAREVEADALADPID